MGTSVNDLRVNIAVENREAQARIAAFNKSQEFLAKTAEISSRRAARAQVEASEATTRALNKQAEAAKLATQAAGATENKALVQAATQAQREYEKLAVAAERANDRAASSALRAKAAQDQLTRSAAGSSRARTQAEREHAAALKRVETGIAAAERRSITFGLRGVDALRAQREEALRLARAVGASEPQINRLTAAYARMEKQAKDAQAPRGAGFFSTAGGLARSATGVLGGIGLAVGAQQTTQFVKESVQATARVEQLGISLDVLAQRFHQSRSAMAVTEAQLRSMNLTQVQSRDAIQLFTRAGATQEQVIQLVGVAMDAAARRGRTMEDALTRLSEAAAKAEPELLDELGIVIRLREVYASYAKQLGITNADSLTAAQRSKAIIEALAEGRQRGGEAAAAVGTLSDSLLKAAQYGGQLKENLGAVFSPASKALVDAYNSAVKGLSDRLGHLGTFVSQFKEKGLLGLSDSAIIERITRDRLGVLNKQVDEAEQRLKASVGKLFDKPQLTDEQKKDIEAARKIMESAQTAELDGVEKIIAQRRIYIRELGSSREAIELLDKATDASLRKESARLDELLKKEREQTAGLLQRARVAPADASEAIPGLDAGLQRFDQQARQRLDIASRIQREVQDQERRRLDERRDYELAQAESLGATTLEQKIALEDRKLAIEIDYLNRSSALAEAKIQQDIAKEIAANANMAAELYALQAKLLDETAASRVSAIEKAQQSTANRQAELIRDSNQRIFDDLQRQAEGVFDALFTRSGNFFTKLSGLFQSALLTGIKNQFSTAIATLFSGVSGGAGAPAGVAAGGGLLGGLLGGFGGLGGIGRPGAPGGTGGFAGPVASLASSGGRGTLAGLFGGVGGGAAQLAAIKGLFGVGTANGVFLPGGGLATQGTTLSSVLGSTGAGLAGLGVAAAGLYRGGKAGLGMAVGGGALAGFAFGGPVGAAIGAGIGAVAGTIRLLFKGATEKAREKVKSFYGVEIKDKSILEQVVAIAKQGYGGNLDMAIASPQVRDLVELYSMAYGQGGRGFGIDVVSAQLVQRGGQLYQAPSYRYNVPYTLASNLPIAPGTVPAGAQQINVIQLDRSATADLWQGEMVDLSERQPRVFQKAISRAQSQNYDRRGSFARAAEPGTVLA